jgi:hypothetical protein
MSRPTLLRLAGSTARNKHVVADHLAKRSKECLICWFCGVAPELLCGSNVLTPPPAIVPSNRATAQGDADVFEYLCAAFADAELHGDGSDWMTEHFDYW